MSKSNSVVKLYSSICIQNIGVQKRTTNIGVVSHPFLTFYQIFYKKLRTYQEMKCKYILLSAFYESNLVKLPWPENIYALKDNVGMTTFVSINI